MHKLKVQHLLWKVGCSRVMDSSPLVKERHFDIWQLMRSSKYYDQQNQERFRCLIHSQDAIRCRPLQENATKNSMGGLENVSEDNIQ